MNLNQIPVACSLTAEERPGRREKLDLIGESIVEIQEREQGYAYRFDTDAILPEIIDIIHLERQCCPFFRFSLSFEPGIGPIWLEVTGPEGTKSFLDEMWKKST